MKSQQPMTPEQEHRVLQFRPRTPPLRQDVAGQSAGEGGEPLDLWRQQKAKDEPDDFRHRMLANIAAFAFTVALTAVGIWLAMSIADLRKSQDCALMGRRDCARISAPHF